MALQGQKLTEAIEEELRIMLEEGYLRAPITPSSLHKRLLAKKIIRGKLSSLSSRRTLVDRYTNLQLELSGLQTEEAKLNAKSSRTRAGYKKRYEEARAEIQHLNTKLDENVATLINLVQHIESSSPIPVEKLLTPYLLNAYNQEEDAGEDA